MAAGLMAAVQKDKVTKRSADTGASAHVCG